MTITEERRSEEQVTVTDQRSEAVARAARRWLSRISETPDGHWPWPGQLAGDGPPICQVGIAGKPVGFRANRLLWEAIVGVVPDGHVLRSTCGYPACVNPACHEALTRVELGRRIDSPMGINARKDTCVRGHPLSGVGSDVYRRKSGGRQCRACDREREREQAAARRVERRLTVAQRWRGVEAEGVEEPPDALAEAARERLTPHLPTDAGDDAPALAEQENT